MALSDLKGRYSAPLNPLRAERRLELVAVLAAALFALQLLWGTVSRLTYGGPDAIRPAPDSLVVAAMSEQSVPADAESQEIVSRPLFWESRRPENAPAEAVVAQPASSKAKKLEGVKVVGIFGSGTTGGAIVIAKGKKQRVAVNGTLEGWQLESVAPDRAVFISGEDRDEKMLSTAATNVQYNTATPAGPAPETVPQAEQQESSDDQLTLGG